MQLELNQIQTNMTKTLSARSAGDFCTKYKQNTNKIRPENLLGAERRSNFRQFWDPGDVSFVPTVGHRTLAMIFLLAACALRPVSMLAPAGSD